MADASSEAPNSLEKSQTETDGIDEGGFPVDKHQVIDTEVVSNTKASSGLLRREVSVVLQEGPLPPAEELEKYNSIIPNGADRIMTMAEKEQIHRQGIESIITKSVASQNSRGQWFAFVIAISALIFAAYLFNLGKDGYAISLICGDFLLISGAFIGLRLWRSKDEDQEQDDEGK
jgi:uncharacterized membrane protein